MTGSDPVLSRILAALAAGPTAGSDATRAALAALWAEVGPDGDPLHVCLIGHYAADLESDPAAELAWDRLALAAADRLTDARLEAFHPTLSVAGFLPSLHLNVADAAFRCGERAIAEAELDAADATAPALPEDGYDRMIRTGIARLRERLASPR